jgi:hypothetical protein
MRGPVTRLRSDGNSEDIELSALGSNELDMCRLTCQSDGQDQLAGKNYQALEIPVLTILGARRPAKDANRSRGFQQGSTGRQQWAVLTGSQLTK